MLALVLVFTLVVLVVKYLVGGLLLGLLVMLFGACLYLAGLGVYGCCAFWGVAVDLWLLWSVCGLGLCWV